MPIPESLLLHSGFSKQEERPRLQVLFVSSKSIKSNISLTGPERVNYELMQELIHRTEKVICYFLAPTNAAHFLVARTLKRQQHSIILHVGNQSPKSILLLLFARLLGVRATTTFHGDAAVERAMGESRSLLAVICQFIAGKLSNTVVAVTPHPEKYFHYVKREKLKSIPNGCREADESASSIIIRPKSVPSALKIGAAGGSRAVKGLDFLIGALCSISDQPVELHIFGPLYDSEEASKKLEKHGHMLIHHGDLPRSDFLESVRVLHVFCQVSKYEPFGMAGLDAFMQGVPLILTEQSGLAGVFLSRSDMEGFCTVQYDDVNQLASLIKNKKFARRVVIKKENLLYFCWARVAQDYIDLWEVLDAL